MEQITFYELMKELECLKYYVVEIDGSDTDGCAEYEVTPDEVNDRLGNCKVIDHDCVSELFAVVYVDVSEIDEPKKEEDDDNLIQDITEILAGFVKRGDKNIELFVGIYPEEGIFTIGELE